jgi:hypothetical protein
MGDHGLQVLRTSSCGFINWDKGAAECRRLYVRGRGPVRPIVPGTLQQIYKSIKKQQCSGCSSVVELWVPSLPLPNQTPINSPRRTPGSHRGTGEGLRAWTPDRVPTPQAIPGHGADVSPTGHRSFQVQFLFRALRTVHAPGSHGTHCHQELEETGGFFFL